MNASEMAINLLSENCGIPVELVYDFIQKNKTKDECISGEYFDANWVREIIGARFTGELKCPGMTNNEIEELLSSLDRNDMVWNMHEESVYDELQEGMERLLGERKAKAEQVNNYQK
jgi:hypothetical protein